MSLGVKQAAFLHPTFPNLVLFFSGNQYVIIDAQVQDRNKNILFGPRYIAQDWPALVMAGFDSGVDAILPDPKDPTTAYFFSDGRYALVKVSPPGGPQLSTIVDGPHNLSQWKAINKAGYRRVDGVFTITSGGAYYAYVFSGDTYISVDIDPASDRSWSVRKISTEWTSLNTLGSAFVQDLSVVFPAPGDPRQAYFLKGDKYCLVGGIVSCTYHIRCVVKGLELTVPGSARR